MSDIERIPSRPDSSRNAPDSVPPDTVRELLERVDAGWQAFRAAVFRFPGERMDERVSEHAWTRKQMLAHITTWHDLTHERLGRLRATGKPVSLNDEVDTINAQAARQAVGKTAGEIVKDMESSFAKLRRQVERMSDDHLQMNDAWAAKVVAANTYGHYDEHMDDLYAPETAQEAAGRR